jgi:E3 ubiquitin-protein ligase BRE1
MTFRYLNLSYKRHNIIYLAVLMSVFMNYGCVSNRSVMELQQAEGKARAQVQRLKIALDEHNLELRVKAANEAEAACQQRLTAAEADIAELRQQLDDSERLVTVTL